ncbi:MAG: carbon monoxide dehydrogenase subunit G [Thaumarchaeota archaeon]|nr:carbon monoxide dehydrogenase subunit G [Nitrososphaerota archaeon]
MHYDGTFDVKAPKEKVYDFITDPKKITTIFPDVSAVKVLDADNFTLKAKVGMSFIRGTMDVKGSVAEKKKPTSARMKARGNGLNSSVDLDSLFTMEDGPQGGTHVTWSADAKISGMMASIGSRLIESQADKYVKQIIGSLEKKLS